MFSNSTEHFHLPQYSGNDTLSVLDDLNETNEILDTALFEQGEALASIMRDNQLIHNELTEIRHENSTIQLEVVALQQKDREQDKRLDGIDDVIAVLTAEDPTEPTPDWKDPTNPNFDKERYMEYVTLTTKQTQVENIYPVGIILAFGNTTDPNDIFTSGSNTDVDWDTTWVALDEGYVLQQGTASNVGQKNAVSANAKSVTLSGNTGSHVLTVNEMPEHYHVIEPTACVVETKYNGDDYAPLGHVPDNSPGTKEGELNTGTQHAYCYISNGGFHSIQIAATLPITNTNTRGNSAGHSHSFSNVAVNYNAESPAYYVRYWKRTA